MNEGTTVFLQLAKHPIKFRLFLLAKLPNAFFSGLKIVTADEEKCAVSIPYKWFTKNPFRSTYFACLSMAAEMSTGALAMAHLYKRKPTVSMLVVKVESAYFKKAIGKTIFICDDGAAIQKAIEECISTNQATTIRAKSVGTNNNGEVLAEFFITWTFKAKS